jgi:hypothetical protein
MRRLTMQLGVGLSFFFFQVQGRGGGGGYFVFFCLLPTCSQCGPIKFPSMFPKFPMCSLGLSQLHLDFIPHCLAIVQLPCILSYTSGYLWPSDTVKSPKSEWGGGEQKKTKLVGFKCVVKDIKAWLQFFISFPAL